MLKDFLFCLIFFILSFPLGYLFLGTLFRKGLINTFELIVFSEILGSVVGALAIFSITLILPFTLSLWIVGLIALLLTFLFRNEMKKLKIIDFLGNKRILVFNLIWVVVFSYVIIQTHLLPLDGGYNTSPSTYGDLPFHLGIITNFAYGDNFPPVNPIAPFSRLSYHFVADFISSILLTMGSSIRGAIIFPSIFFGLLLVNSFYLLTLKITKSNLTSLLSPFIFLFCGGIGFIKFFELFNVEDIRFAHFPELGIEYPNILAESMMAQRAMTMGIPLWIASLFFFYLWFSQKEIKSLYLAAILTALMPYVHIYAFLVNIFVTFFLMVFDLVTHNFKKTVFNWMKFLILIILIISPFLLWIFPQITHGGSFMRISLFEWPALEHPFNWLFWITNFGTIPIMILASLFLGPKLTKSATQFLYTVSGLILISHIIIFQPYVWDNNRFIIYPFVTVSIIAASFIGKLISHNLKSVRYMGVLLFIASTISGILVTIFDPGIHYELFNKKDFEISEKINTLTDKDGVFLTARNHNNIISALAGRRVFLGFGGYLWTHGIDDTFAIEETIESIYSCSDNIESLILKNNIRYIVISGWERQEYDYMNEECLTSKYMAILDENGIKVLDTNYDTSNIN